MVKMILYYSQTLFVALFCVRTNLFATLFFIFIAESSTQPVPDTSTGDPVWNIRHVLPDLDVANNSVTEVKFNVGDNAFLPCRFPRYSRHHENAVSWFRRWDWQILTAGLFSYTNDDRFAVLHREGSDDWTLQIKYVQLSDNGTYECQVHTGNGFLSHYVKLSVIRPRAVILGPEDLHVRTGDHFSVTCVIEKVLSRPIFIIWQHRNKSMNYAAGKPRLKISVNQEGVHTTSTLSVINTQYEDSGNYTCSTPNSEAAAVRVYVTEGDTVAAVQRRNMKNGCPEGAVPATFFLASRNLLTLLLYMNRIV